MGYIIQGTFFRVSKDFATAPVTGDSSQSVMFAGSFRKDDSDTFIGAMIDRVGESQLTDIVLTETKFSFTKKYLHRKDAIRYSFKKQADDMWDGEWAGDACGYGLAKCAVLPVPDAVFQPLILFGNECFQCRQPT